MKRRLFISCLCFASVQLSLAEVPEEVFWDPNTQADNVGSILETRHNLTMSYTNAASTMTLNAINDYEEVCVYCHTPHGANRQVDAPLWNRSRSTQVYKVYNNPRAYDQPITAPGPNSLTCLSCHDGATSVDSIINMPTRKLPDGPYYGARAGYSQQAEVVSRIPGTNRATNTGFLDQWEKTPGDAGPLAHRSLINNNSGNDSCRTCHDGRTSVIEPGRTIPDFNGFQVAENFDNLKNDHPIGVTYPTINRQPNPDYPAFDRVSTLSDYNAPRGVAADSAGRTFFFFDTNNSGKLDKNEIRLYNSGQGAEIECATCHDPHGVPSDMNVANSPFINSFLRVTNKEIGTTGDLLHVGSKLCLTCHAMDDQIIQ